MVRRIERSSNVVERWVVTGCLAYTLLAQFATNSLKSTIGDATLFAYGGRLIANGAIPYLDFWDNKPPGIFYIEALSYWLFGTTWLGPTLVQAAVHVATVRAFAWAARRLAPDRPLSRISFVVVLTLMMNLPMFTMDGANLTQNYLLLPVALALGLLNPLASSPALAAWAGAGALSGMAFLIRPNAIALGWLALLSLALHVPLPWRSNAPAQTLCGLPAWRRHECLRAVLCFAGGGALPLALTSAYFAAHGVLGEMWFASLTYNVTDYKELFLNRPTLSDARRYFMFEWRFGLNGLYAAGVAGSALLLARGRSLVSIDSGRTASLIVLSLSWVLCELSLVIATGHPYPHYLLMLVPSGALFASLLFAEASAPRLTGRIKGPAGWVLRAVGVSLLVLACAPVVRPMPAQILSGIRRAAAPFPTADQMLALYIRQVAGPTDPVMTLGHFHGHMMSLGTPPAVPVLSTFHLKRNYGNNRWTGQYIDVLETAPPKVVVITDGYWNPAAKRGPVPAGARAREHERPEIERRIREQYVLARERCDQRRRDGRKDLPRPPARRTYLPRLSESSSWF
jgi:hypothetical protein